MGRVCEVLRALRQECTCVLPKPWTLIRFPPVTSTLIALCLPLLITTAARPAEATRENVEAAYLFRFLNFVDFPPGTPAGSSAFCLCTLGGDRIGHALEMSVTGKSIADRPVTVKVLTNAHEAKICHLLFLSGGKQMVIGELAETATQPILTITDLPDLRQHGEVIHLSFRDDRLRFEIDVEDAKRRGLNISSRLIQLSRSSQ